MLRGGYEIQRVLPYRYGVDQGMRFRCQGNDCQFGSTMQNLIVGLFRIQELNIQRHSRVLAGESPQ
ncbi:hypothetical protein EDP1_3997 [Pseudomonas putida S610]|nr:hypothetical protein EDP1_3997 [Pseudomonas putida S610]